MNELESIDKFLKEESYELPPEIAEGIRQSAAVTAMYFRSLILGGMDRAEAFNMTSVWLQITTANANRGNHA